MTSQASGSVDTSVSTASGVGPISAPMVAALEGAWAAIRARHPEVPAAMVVLGAGSIGVAGGLRLGHFAAMRWAGPDQPPATGQPAEGGELVRLPEVFVGGEGLARGPAEVLATLLHEAAHALAHVRGIKDTSRQGRWHNARFKALAEEVGIEVSKDDRIGWSPTTLPTDTRDSYDEVIAGLGQALRLHRAVEITGGRAKKPGPPSCVCGCGRRIRVAPSVLEAGPITCGVCGDEFAPDLPADLADPDDSADQAGDDEPDTDSDGDEDDGAGR
jgi:hypothetical protein